MKLSAILNAVKECFDEIPASDARANLGPRDFIVNLVFSFGRDRGNKRSLENLRRSMQSISNQTMSRSSFWERLAAKRLQKLLRLLVAQMIQKIGRQLSVTSELFKSLDVTSIVLLDSSSCSLPDDAQENFPAPRNNVVPSAIKLHLCFDLIHGAVQWFKLTPATSHDRKSFPPLNTLVGKLIIFDLGYWDYRTTAYLPV